MEDGLGAIQELGQYCEDNNVLILVLVEDGLGEESLLHINKQVHVLILVLVEDGLGVVIKDQQGGTYQEVLILVLVEDGLGD